MADHGSGGGVLNFGVRDHADGFPGGAAQEFRDGFLPGIVQRVGGAVGVDAQRVDARLVAGHVGRGGVGGVGGDGIHAARAEHGRVGQAVHGQLAVVHAVGDALGQQAGAGAVSHAQAVRDEQDDVFRRRLFRRTVDFPCGRGLPGGAFRSHLVGAGFQGGVAQQQGGGVHSLFLFDEGRFRPEHGRGVLAVDEHLGVLLVDHAVELHLEVEAAPAQKAGRVHGIDAGGRLRRARKKHDAEQGGDKASFHE